MTQAKSTIQQALRLETPLREIRNLTWAIIMMAEGLDDQQAASAVNDVACAVHDKVQVLTDQWNELVDNLRDPEGISAETTATVLHIVPKVEA